MSDVESSDDTDQIAEILGREFGDRVYSVENGVVWVSGMNSGCKSLAQRMAKTLAHGHDIPAGLVYDDGATRFGGVQFNWGDSA